MLLISQPTQQHKDYAGDHRGPKGRAERSDRDNHNVALLQAYGLVKVRMTKARRKGNKARIKKKKNEAYKLRNVLNRERVRRQAPSRCTNHSSFGDQKKR